MDFIWILFAFICGLATKSISLPPSIGYLIAGFALNFMGMQADNTILTLADLGITLMLFTIGLKLNIADLLKREVWFGSISHASLWLVVIVVLLKLMAVFAIPYIANLSNQTLALIVFALSFSSTVCVVKLLEDHGEMKTRHGKLAIGILVMQDIFAVIFLVLATQKMPSIWALSLLLALPLKPLANRLIDQVGHGELLPLAGFFITFGAYELFEWLNIKGDLGALLVGMYFATHAKATEIAKSLLSFKDIFLIGFFLSVGFAALPSIEMVLTATLLTLIIPIKFVLFFALFTALRLRARTAFLSALALSNFSEFGLIIAALSGKYGWLSAEWLVILSIAVSFSFVITNVLYNYAHEFYARHRESFLKYEKSERLDEDIFIQPCDAPICIIGMGRVGKGAYLALDGQVKGQAWGLDTDKDKVSQLQQEGYQSYFGDAEDADFWERIYLDRIELILLALPSIQDIKNITYQLKHAEFQGKIAAIARYSDEQEELQTFGVDKVFNFYSEVGVGFAEESKALIAC